MNKNKSPQYQILIIVIFVMLIYGQSISFDYLRYDDSFCIFQNSYTNGSVSCTILEYFFPGFIRQDVYIPLTFLLLRFIYIISGGTVWVFHLFSSLLYSCSCVAVFFFLKKFLSFISKSDYKGYETSFIRHLDKLYFKDSLPLIATLIFASLPCHVENIAWISSIGYSPSIISCLFSIICFLNYIEKKNINQYVISVVLFITAVLFQPAALVTPGLIIICLVCFRKNCIHEAVKAFIIYGSLSCLYMYIFLRHTVWTSNSAPLSLIQKLTFQGRYLFNLFIPVDLMPGYSRDQGIIFIIPLILFISIAFYMIFIKKSSLWIFFILWYTAALFPYSGIFFGKDICDRYLIIPSISSSLIIAFYALIIPRILHKKIRKLRLSISIGILVFYTSLTLIYMPVWSNDDVFFTYAYHANPKAIQFSGVYGMDCIEKGKFEEAIDVSEVIINDGRDPYTGYSMKIQALCSMKQYDKAMSYAINAIEKYPNLYAMNEYAGNICFLKGDYEKAYSYFKTSLSLYIEHRANPSAINNVSLKALQSAYMSKDEEKIIQLASNIFPDIPEEIKNPKTRTKKACSDFIKNNKNSPSSIFIQKIVDLK